MGSVWEGVHVSLGTRVAVKFIESDFADVPEARTRFEKEARATATLKSKHVVQVHDHGVMADGRPYIVMEFLSGEPLDSRLERVGRLRPEEVVRLVQQVARALTRAHSAGIVHRDLKPENIFLVWDEEDGCDIAKVVDFGIAKFTDNSSFGVSSATRTGSVLGTPYYMSPEQARGVRSVDARADLWALGVIVYRCLTGVLPFDGEALVDLLVKVCTADPVPPSQLQPELPRSFDGWVARALDRNPETRFQSAQEMAEQLGLSLGVTLFGRGSMGSMGSGEASTVLTHASAGADTSSMYTATSAAGTAGTMGALTQTPPLGLPRRSSSVPLIALGGVLGVGALVAGALLLFSRPSAAPTPPEVAASSAPVASAAPTSPVEPAVVASAAPVVATVVTTATSTGTGPAVAASSVASSSVAQSASRPPAVRTATSGGRVTPPPHTGGTGRTGGRTGGGDIDVGY